MKEKPATAFLVKSIVLASAVSLGASFSIAFMLRDHIEGFDPGFAGKNYLQLVLHAVILGPALETLVLAAAISGFLLPLFGRTWIVVSLSAALWAILHGLIFWVWGVVIFLPFAVYSFMYLRFREYGWRWAFLAAFSSHALHNLVAVSLGAG